MAEFLGWQKYLVMRPENVWGVYPDSQPSSELLDIFLPYTDYSVSVQRQLVQPQYFLGVRQRRSNRVTRATLGGSINAPLLGVHVAGKSIAEHLVSWAMSAPRSAFLDSMSAIVHEDGVDDKLHTGLRVASMTIAGGEGDGLVSISLDVQGKREYGSESSISAPPLDETQPQPVEFLFADTTLYVSFDESQGSLVTSEEEQQPISSFSINVENVLEVKNRNSYWPEIIAAGSRSASFQFTIDKVGPLYDRLRRESDVTNAAARLVMKCPHLGTASGTHTVVEAHFDRLNFSTAADQVALDAIVTQQVDWLALKPSSFSNDVDFFFGVE